MRGEHAALSHTGRLVALDGAASVRDRSGAPRHALTVDLEEWYHGVELDPVDWPAESRLRVGLDRLLTLMGEHDIKGTFFVLGVVADRFPMLIEELARGGHEIGCHGHLHQFVYRQTPEEFRADLVRARDAIAAATGVVPTGYRAPYFSVREDSRWALDVLASEGFLYDSSIFPVRNDRYGIPDAQRQPFDVGTPSGWLTEVPLTPVRIAGVNVPFAGGAYLRILPGAVQRLAWWVAERQRIRVVAYIHPWELDPDHPRIPLRRRVAATHYARLRVTEIRLRQLFRDHRFGRLDDVFALA